MKKIIVLVLVTLMLCMPILGGCNNSDKVDNVNKVLKIGFKEINSSFDPHYSSGTDCFGTMQVYDTLIVTDENNEFKPSIAEKWDISDDGKEYTFYLKKGIKFHNGDELKANDVKFSFERGIDSPYVSVIYSMLDKVEIINDYTVKVFLKEPYVPFLSGISIVFGAIVNEKVVTQYGEEYGKSLESIVGTGPYKVKSWTQGQSVAFESYSDYFNGEAPIKNVEVKLVSDDTTAVVSLQTGELDVFDNVPNVNLKDLKSNKDLSVIEYPGMTYVYTLINHSKPPFNDKKLRQAMAYGINRENFILFAAEGMGESCICPATNGFIGYPDGVSWYDYDVEKAKKLVEESDYDKSKIVSIKATATNTNIKLATTLQEELSNMGINAEVNLIERSAMLDDIYVNADYELSIQSYGIISKDMDFLYTHLHSSMLGLGGNASLYSSKEMDEYLSKGRSEMNSEKRKEYYKGAVEMFVDDVVHIPLYYPSLNRVIRNTVKAITVNPNYDFVFINQLDWN